MSRNTVLRLADVSVTFDGRRALDRVSLKFARGRVTALVGPNGAGKTTVFNVICGLTRPDEGEVYYHNNSILGRKPWEIMRLGIGRTFQDMLLFEGLTVLQNVMVVLQGTDAGEEARRRVLSTIFPRRVAEGERAAQAMALLRQVGLQAKADEPADSLSHGEQKILSIARLLAARAEVLLLDEPIAWIHEGLVDTVLGIIRDLAAAGKTVVIIEHDMRLLGELLDTDYYYLLDSGRVAEQGSPREFLSKYRCQSARAGAGY